MRTPWGEYPEYHTSADDLAFVTPAALGDAVETCRRIVCVLEGNEVPINRNPYGEPQLGRRGLYTPLGGRPLDDDVLTAQLWVLNLGDRSHDLLEIAERSGLPFAAVRSAAVRLRDAGLLDLS